MKYDFVPLFLRKIDKYLLEKYPIVWETNIHYFIFYAIPVNLILAVIGFLLPIFENIISLVEISLLFQIIILICVSYRKAKTVSFGKLSQSLLRLLMCILIVVIWDLTIHNIPNVIYLRLMYDKEQVEEDAFYVEKTRFLSNFIRKIYFLPEREKYLSLLKKSHFNQHNEINEILEEISRFEKIIEIYLSTNNEKIKDSLKNDVQKIENAIEVEKILKYNLSKETNYQELNTVYYHLFDKFIKTSHFYTITKKYEKKATNDLFIASKIDKNHIITIAKYLYIVNAFVYNQRFSIIQNKILFGKNYPYKIKEYRLVHNFQGYYHFFKKKQEPELHQVNLLLINKMLDVNRMKQIFFEEPEHHKGQLNRTDNNKRFMLAYWLLFPLILLVGRSIRFIDIILVIGILFLIISLFISITNYFFIFISLFLFISYCFSIFIYFQLLLKDKYIFRTYQVLKSVFNVARLSLIVILFIFTYLRLFVNDDILFSYYFIPYILLDIVIFYMISNHNKFFVEYTKNDFS